jgi:hypothetical protein
VLVFSLELWVLKFFPARRKRDRSEVLLGVAKRKFSPSPVDGSVALQRSCSKVRPPFPFVIPYLISLVKNGGAFLIRSEAKKEKKNWRPRSKLLTQTRATSFHSQEAPRREYRFKVIVVGTGGTGKTSIIKRFVNNYFSKNYKATVSEVDSCRVPGWIN